MSDRHPVAESAAAVEGNQEPDAVRSRLWRRLVSGEEMGARVHPERALGGLQPR